MNNSPRTEFSQALKAIASERGLDPDVILSTIKEAIIAAYKEMPENKVSMLILLNMMQF